MNKEEVTAIFDQQAASYDQQWSRLASINDVLHLLAGAVLAELPVRASVLCIGAGTGAEVLYLAGKYPEWHFTVVEPSGAMLAVCRRKMEEAGVISRCSFHTAYLDSLPPADCFDAATAFLVSQFMLDRDSRVAFFQGIADRLRPEGILVSSDLAGELRAAECQALLQVWFRVMTNGGIPPEGIEKMRSAYERDVAVLPPRDVREIMRDGGFDLPVHLFQAGMIHAWYAKRSPKEAPAD